MARSRRRSAFPRNNPYNFVPGDKPIKKHQQSPKLSRFEGLSGHIECILTNETPLMVAGKRDENSEQKKLDFFKINGKLAIPGTSLKGMARSVLEAVTNACFSVFDGDRLDYRDPYFATKLKAGQVIQEAKDGQQGQIQLMERGWIAMKGKSKTVSGMQGGALHNFTLATVPSGTKSGDKVWIQYEKIDRYRNSRGRNIPGPFHLITAISSTAKSGYTEGIYKITGQSINHKRQDLKKRERIFFPASGGTIYNFSQKEVDDYNYILEQQVERWEAQGGFDLLERNPLSEGSLVYFVPESGNQAKFISRVEVPRVRYEKSREDLLPAEYHKCTDPNDLCAACRLFGFVEENKGLSGRIAFTDAEHIEGEGETDDYLDLKVLGTPHPTSYNFYLIDPNNPSTVRNYDGHKIVKAGRGVRINREEKGDVKLRGRKFYYHHPNHDDLQKYCCSTGTPAKLYSRAKPVLKGNTFQFQVHFRNLSKFELGMLLYCLELEGNLRHKLGMGKSIGFGTVKITVDSLKLTEDSKARYSNFANPPLQEEKENRASYVAGFKEQVAKLVGKTFEQLLNIQKLKQILDPSRSPSNISYPTGGFQWYMNNRNIPLPPL